MSITNLCRNIRRQIQDSIACKSAMFHAFDLPLTAKQFKLVEDLADGNNNSWRFSLTRENGEIIVGFEHTNGNRITFNLGDAITDLPEWLGEEFNIVTSEFGYAIQDTFPRMSMMENIEPDGLNIVCLISLDSIWIVTNASWVLRMTGGSTEEFFMLTDYLQLPNNCSHIGGEAIVRANGRITTDAIAAVDFKTASMAKTVLGRAGRSRPQGDLIVYFSEESCAAEGYNSMGDTTLELGPIGGNRQIEAYNSELTDERIIPVKFNYPFYFRKLFSSKEGILTDNNVEIKTSKVSYGTTEHGKPHVKVTMANATVEFVKQTEENVFRRPDFEMPELKLGNNKPAKKTQTSPEVPKVESTKIAFSELVEEGNIIVPEGYEENLKDWFDAYIESNDANNDPRTWFTSYMMKCAREGTPIRISDRDAYREVTNAYKNQE